MRALAAWLDSATTASSWAQAVVSPGLAGPAAPSSPGSVPGWAPGSALAGAAGSASPLGSGLGAGLGGGLLAGPGDAGHLRDARGERGQRLLRLPDLVPGRLAPFGQPVLHGAEPAGTEQFLQQLAPFVGVGVQELRELPLRQ